jgi:hypothetical protein
VPSLRGGSSLGHLEFIEDQGLREAFPQAGMSKVMRDQDLGSFHCASAR